MELTNILSGFFVRHGDSFKTNSEDTPYYGRLSLKQKSDCGKSIVAPLGKGITGEYELVAPVVESLTLSKGVTVLCADKKFIVTATSEYTLNDKPLYVHAVLREVGADL